MCSLASQRMCHIKRDIEHTNKIKCEEIIPLFDIDGTFYCILTKSLHQEIKVFAHVPFLVFQNLVREPRGEISSASSKQINIIFLVNLGRLKLTSFSHAIRH